MSTHKADYRFPVRGSNHDELVKEARQQITSFLGLSSYDGAEEYVLSVDFDTTNDYDETWDGRGYTVIVHGALSADVYVKFKNLDF